jgi:hypothetical protein
MRLHQWHRMWFVHDSALPHFLRIYRQHLKQNFDQHWIGRRWAINRLPRSRDLSSLNCWLWIHLNTALYSMPIGDFAILQQRVENSSQKCRMWTSVRRKLNLCWNFVGSTNWNRCRVHTNIVHTLSGHLMIGRMCSLKCYTILRFLRPIKSCNPFPNTLYKPQRRKQKAVSLVEASWLYRIMIHSVFQNSANWLVKYAETKQNKLHGLSPRANYTDRATAACRRTDCQLLRIEGATWSAWRIPTAVFSVF